MSSVKQIQSVRNACTLLEAIVEHQPVGISELARVTSIEKSAAHRLAVTLHRSGWLDQTSDGSWRIAPSLRRLMHRAATDSLTSTVRPHMEMLRDQSAETVMLVVIDHGRLLVIDVVDSRHNLRITAPVNSELPLLHSSAVRAIAAHLPADELAALRSAHPALDDDHTLDVVRRRGWAMNDREILPDVRVVGAPLLTSDGYPLAALIICGPTSRVTQTRMNELGRLLARTANAIVTP